MTDFKRSLAVVIGINEYQDYPKLQTARYDAERLAQILATEHKYDYVILVTDDTYKEYLKGQELPVKNKYKPTFNGLLNLLSKRVPAEINPTKEDRLLFYFAGHGIPDESDEGPKGYLVPLDADSKKRDSLLPMQELYKYLAALNCRHFLIVLDCCFAGRFRWSSTRKGRTFPRVIHKEHYDRFIDSPAWQAITSASHDQEAFDILGDNRGTVEGTNHSPFAEGLFKALRGEADVIPAGKNGQPAGDGVITATELYLYLREQVEIGSKERQTPGLWSLPKHERGEYIFLVPGANPKLKPAPNVNEKNNPYRGLESFDEEHFRLFFGREELIQQLSERISAPKQPLTVVLGVSGSGKSSLVKAGLIPRLKKLSESEVFEVNLVSAYTLTSAIVQAFPQVPPKFWPINYVHQWHILNPMRPGESPFTALAKTVLALADITGSNQPDTLNFLNVSKSLDNLTFLTEVLEQKVNALKAEVDESSFENGEESSETLRLQKEVAQFNSITQRWKQGTQKAKQLLIVGHFEELYTLGRNPAEKQQLQQAVSDCLNPLSLRLQSDPSQLINIVKAWSQKNPGLRLLLTIDQFEELITLSQGKQKEQQNNQQQQKKFSNQPTQAVQQKNKQQEWQQFLNLLEKTLSANLEQLRILVTLRSDFEPRFLNSDGLKSYWTKARFPVRAMRSDELRQAIERPAAEIALYFEPPNLVDRLIDEVGQMPGALPLLSFTLSELYIKLAQKWRNQETSDRALTLDADFDKQGGVAGSLTRRANEEYDNLPDDAHRATLRRVMLRMVTTEGGESARRRVPESELEYTDATENERVKEVLKRFDHARLIVSGQETGEPYVEPAHDFLVRSWDKLQKWQQEEQQDLLLQRRLTPAALEWKNKEQSASVLAKAEPVLDWFDKRIDSVEDWLNKIKKNDQQSQREKKRQFLWNGNPYLDVLKNRLKTYDHWFNQLEAEFVQQSVWQRRRNTNLRWVIAMGVILGLGSLTFWALREQRNALIGQIRAFQQASDAEWGLNQDLDAAINALRAGNALDKLLPFGLFKPDAESAQVRGTLQKVSYTERVKEYNRLEEDSGSLLNVVFSPDGQTIVAANSNNSVTIWSFEGIKLQTLRGHNDRVTSVAFSPDGQTIATASDDQTVKLWKRNSTGQFNTQPEQTLTGHGGKVTSVAFSPDGQTIATASDDQTVKLWKRNSTRQFETQSDKTLIGHNPGVKSVAFSPDGQTIVTASDQGDGTVQIWSIEGQELPTLRGENGGVTSVAFSPDGQMLVASANSKGTIKLWKRDFTGQFATQLDINPGVGIRSIRSVAFSPDGQRLALGTEDRTVVLWNLQDKVAQTLTGHTGWVLSVAFSPNKKTLTLASSSQDSTIKLWRFEGKKLPSLINVHKAAIWSIAISPNGEMLASASFDGTVKLWKWDGTGQFETQPYKTLTAHRGLIKSVVFSPDGQTIATANDDSTVTLWSIEGQELQTLTGHNGGVVSVAFSHNGQIIASGRRDIVILWRRDSTGQFQTQTYKTLTGHKGTINSIAFSPNDQTIATAGEDNTVKLWSLNESKELQTLTGHKDGVNSVVFSPDGQTIATASADTSIKLWKRGFTGQFETQPYKTLTGHTSWVNSVAFSPNGQMLASASEDKTVKLWTLEGKELQTLYGHEDRPGDNNWIRSVVFSPDSKKIVSAGAGKVILWDLEDFSLDKLMEPACNWVRDYLKNNPNVSESDRHLCDNIPPSTPSLQTTTANSSAPSIVQPPAQKAPSPTPSSNNGKDTPSSSAPANAPARPQNVPSPTPPSNNGQNNYRQAPSDRNQASNLNSTSVDAYINQGLTYYKQRNYQQAISSYSKEIALNPNSFIAYSYRASAYIGQKDYQKAIADSSKAISLNPTYVNAYINRGLAYYRQGNYKEAIANYNKAIKLAPGNANAYNNRGLAYTRLGNQQAAQADKRKAAILSQRQSQ